MLALLACLLIGGGGGGGRGGVVRVWSSWFFTFDSCRARLEGLFRGGGV